MLRYSGRRIGFGLAVIALVSGAGLMLRAEPPQEVGTWASIGASPEDRVGATSVALPDGRTVIAGGLAGGIPTDAVVLFDPETGSFSAIGQLTAPRTGHTATLLEDGSIMIAGGTVNELLTGDIEIYDLSTGTATLAATMTELRSGHAAARLPNGSVLIAGGIGPDGALQSAEIFDPAAGTSAVTSPLLVARTSASATRLIDGRVLIAGGSDGNQDLLSAEIFDPASQSFQPTDTNLTEPRSGHTAVLLPHNNSVLIAGGTSDTVPLATVDLFLPAEFPDPFSYGMGQFTPTDEMAAPRSGAAGGPHVEGYAYVTGGGAADAEVYRFATIKTDKDDYAPGERAVITGSGWQPNEEVTLLFQEDPAVHADYTFTVTADTEGNIYHDQWAPEEHDLNVRFYLMAKQSTPDGIRRAQMTFTDSNNFDVTVTPSSVAPGSTNDFTFTFDATNAGNPGGATTLVVPAGWTAPQTTGPGAGEVTVSGCASAVSASGMTISVTQSGNAGNGSCSGTQIFTLSYKQATAPVATATYTFASNHANPDPTVTVVAKKIGTVLVGAQVGALTYGTGGSVTYPITVNRNGAVGTAFTANLSITTTLPAGATASFSPASVSFAASDTSKSSTLTITTTSSTPAGATVFTVQAANPAVPGDSSTGNGTLTIGQKTLTITAANTSKTYGQTVVFDDTTPSTDFSVSGLVGSDTVTSITLTSAGAAATASVSGSPYDIVPSAPVGTGLANYAIGYVNGSLVVAPADLTITAASTSKTYGTAVVFDETTPSTDFSVVGLLNSDTVDSVTLTSAGAAATATVAGSPYAIVPSNAVGTGLGNYDIDYFDGELVVNTRGLTITADDQTKTYGEVFTFTGTEFTTGMGQLVNGDTVTSVTLTSAGEPATATVAGGPYAIAASNAVGTGLTNYAIGYVDGELEVEARELTITADEQMKTYGEVFTFTGTEFSTGMGQLVNGDTVASVTLTSAGQPATATVAGSPYAIVASNAAGTGLDNYDIDYVDGELVVEARELTITANDQTKTYGDTFSLTGTEFITGMGQLVNGDTVTSVTFASTGAAGTAGVAGSPYAIVASNAVGTGLDNYDIDYVDGELVVNARPIRVAAVSVTKVYGDDDPPLNFVVQGPGGGLVNGDGEEDVFDGALARDPGDDVGTYAITQGTLTVVSENYTLLNFNGGELTITARPIRVAAVSATKVYGDADPIPWAFVVQGQGGGLVLGDTADEVFDGALERAPGDDAGIYAITQGTLTLVSTNYTLLNFNNGELTITARPIRVAAVSATKVYGDADPPLTFVVQGQGGGLVLADTIDEVFDGELARAGDENVGTYAITQGTLVIVSPNYTLLNFNGGEFTITPRPIRVAAVSTGKVYGDADPPLTFVIQGQGGGLVLGDIVDEVFDGELARTGDENVGTYAITQGTLVVASTNYTLLNFNGGEFTITARPIRVAAVSTGKVYGDAEPPLTFVVQGQGGGLMFADTPATVFDGELARTGDENVGTYAITQGTLVVASTNYTLLNFNGGEFTITARPIRVAAVSTGKVYGDAEPPLTFVVQGQGGGLMFADTPATVFAGALDRADGEDVATYAITQGTLTLTSANYTLLNFNGGEFTITARPIRVAAVSTGKVYGDAEPPLTFVVQGQGGGLMFAETPATVFTGALDRADGEDVATYAITQGTLTLTSANYTLLNFNNGEFTITARPIRVAAVSATKVYGEDDPTSFAFVIQGLGGGLVNGDTADGIFDGAPTRATGNDVGTYAITQGTLVLTSPNYTLQNFNNGEFTITARPIRVAAVSTGKVYGDAEPPLEYVVQGQGGGLVLGDTPATVFAGALDRADGENVDTYAITQGSLAVSSANYTLQNFNGGEFTITARPIRVAAVSTGKVYGDAEPPLTYVVQGQGGGLMNGDSADDVFDGALVRAPGNPVGTYAITQGTLDLASANYTLLNFNGGEFTITARPIRVAAVSTTKVYGESDPPLTYVVQGQGGGLVLGDTPATVFSGSLTRASGNAVGTYAITQGTLVITSPNYTLLNFNNGELTITHRTLTITANNRSKNFGETVVFAGTEFTTGAGQLVLGDTVTSVTLTSTGAPAGAGVGSHPIVPSAAVGSGLTNYTIGYVNGTLTVGAWHLTGFYQPVGIPNSVHTAPSVLLPLPVPQTIWNSIKGGQTVPLKFEIFASVGGAERTSVSDVQGFSLVQVPCSGSSYEDPVDFTTTGNTSLRYDGPEGQFIQNWKTPSGANKCYRATMMATDGSAISAFFKAK